MFDNILVRVDILKAAEALQHDLVGRSPGPLVIRATCRRVLSILDALATADWVWRVTQQILALELTSSATCSLVGLSFLRGRASLVDSWEELALCTFVA